jgi:polynucleotide 5'-kinase involved in rRNA processing
MNNFLLQSNLLQPPIKQLEPENITGMFVGLGSKGNVLGFGVIRNVSPGNGILQIQTAINSFDTIHLSNIRLSSDKIMEVRIT